MSGQIWNGTEWVPQEDWCRVHETAVVDLGAKIGRNTSIWHFCHVCAKAVIGDDCILGQGVHVDNGVVIGDKVKIQNYVSLFDGVIIEEGVFIGPHVCFTNDLLPRAVNPDGSRKTNEDWERIETLVKYGASIGANATIVCGVTIGQWAMVAAGSVVTHDVEDYEMVCGVPAHHMRQIDEHGRSR